MSASLCQLACGKGGVLRDTSASTLSHSAGAGISIVVGVTSVPQRFRYDRWRYAIVCLLHVDHLGPAEGVLAWLVRYFWFSCFVWWHSIYNQEGVGVEREVRRRDKKLKGR